MPPKAKITKEMILNTVLDITRETGFETVNARSIASKLKCSTRPIFTCYRNMDELKNEFLVFAFEFYNQYVANYSNSINRNPYLTLPISFSVTTIFTSSSNFTLFLYSQSTWSTGLI